MMRFIFFFPVSLVVATSQKKIQTSEYFKGIDPNCVIKPSIPTSRFHFTSQCNSKSLQKINLGYYNKNVQASSHHHIFLINRGGGNDKFDVVIDSNDEDQIANGATNSNSDQIKVFNDIDHIDKDVEDHDEIHLQETTQNSLSQKSFKPNMTLGYSKDQWISSFRSQIQDIRMEMEREAAIELENVKREILEMRDKKEQILLSSKRNEMKKSFHSSDEEDSNQMNTEILEECKIEQVEECITNLFEDANHVDKSDESEKRLYLPEVNRTLNYNKDEDRKNEKSHEELLKESANNEENDEFLIIGDTDESGDDVLERLKEGTNKVKSSSLHSNTLTADNKIKIDDSKKIATPSRRRKNKSQSQKGGKRRSSKIKKNKGSAMHSGSIATTSTLEPLTKKEISSTFGRRITGRIIQGIILLIFISLVTHILLGEGGGIHLLLKGLFFPHKIVSE